MRPVYLRRTLHRGLRIRITRIPYRFRSLVETLFHQNEDCSSGFSVKRQDATKSKREIERSYSGIDAKKRGVV